MSDASRRFLAGLVTGLLVTGTPALAFALAGRGLADGVAAADLAGSLLGWVWQNLGYSLPVFGVVMLLYVNTLDRLRGALARSAPPEEVRQADHLSDVWTSLFFGVGVIWTAIGMRGALVEALTAGGTGGVEVLERMVDGGILLALSTTIFGGVGGYLMRAWKAMRVGAELARYYERESSRDLAALRASVSAIESGLRLRTGSDRRGEQ